MPRPTRLLALLALLLPSTLASAESSPEALALLDRAIAFQGPEAVAKPGAIHDLTVRLQAEVWDYSKGEGEKQSLGINRFLVMEPERFRTEWVTTGGREISGYDSDAHPALRWWYAHYSPGGGLEQVQRLLGDKNADDRQRIADEFAETKYLLRFFFLANLKGEHVTFTQKDDETIEHFGKKVETRVLRRVNEAPDTTEPPLTIWLDAKTNALLRARAEPKEEDRKEITFSFRYDESVQPRVKGVLFPFKIETHEKPKDAKEPRLTSRATIQENGITFNTGLPESLFLPPKSEK